METFSKKSEILREAKRPGKIYVGVLIAADIAYIQAVKSDFINWLEDRDEEEPGIVGSRADYIGADLYIDNA